MIKWVLILYILINATVADCHAISPFTKFDKQDFKVRAMYEYYYKSGLLTKDEWLDKASKYAKGHNIMIHACSYCQKILYITKPYFPYGISHGGCYDCLLKEYKKYDIEITQDLEDQRKEVFKREFLYHKFLRSG